MSFPSTVRTHYPTKSSVITASFGLIHDQKREVWMERGPHALACVAQWVGASSCKPESFQFDPHSGHIT